MYTEIITEFLESSDYPKNDDGLYMVDITYEKFNFWESLLNSGADYPCLELKKLLDEYVQNYLEKIAYEIWDKNRNINPNAFQVDVRKEIEEIVAEKISVFYDMEKILDRVEDMDICIDTGDSGWDFHANTIKPACDTYYTLRQVIRSASMVWLVKQQGHSIAELGFALKNIVRTPYKIKNPFVRSVANEVYHEMCNENILTFLVKMTVRDMLIINSAIKWRRITKKWGGYIIINKDSSAGFFSSSYGSTSLFGIELENEVKIPIKSIYSVLPDYAYEISDWRMFPASVLSVMGEPELWDKGRVVYKSLPKDFRKNMESMGLEFIPKNIRSTDLS